MFAFCAYPLLILGGGLLRSAGNLPGYPDSETYYYDHYYYYDYHHYYSSRFIGPESDAAGWLLRRHPVASGRSNKPSETQEALAHFSHLPLEVKIGHHQT